MAKGWKNWASNHFEDTRTPAERRAQTKKIDRLLRNTTSPSIEEMRKNADASYLEKVAREESYEKAEAEGKLWSQEKKDAAKAAKKAARRQKRLAAKAS